MLHHKVMEDNSQLHFLLISRSTKYYGMQKSVNHAGGLRSESGEREGLF